MSLPNSGSKARKVLVVILFYDSDIMALRSEAHLAPRFKAAVLAYQVRHDLGNLATAELFGLRATGHKVIAQWTVEHATEVRGSFVCW